MLKDLRKHLEGKGVDPSVLDDYSVESSVDEANAVEADALTQALDALTKAMQPREEEEMMIEDEEEMMSEDDQRSLFELDDNEDLDIEDDEDLDVEKAYYRDAMKALADNTDQMIAEMNKRMDAVLKGVEAMVSEMKGMKGMNEEMEKSLNALRGQPLAPRAVTSAPVSTPETPAAPQRGDVIRKGLKMLQDSSIDAQQKIAVRTAITQLEAGIPVSAISHIIDLD